MSATIRTIVVGVATVEAPDPVLAPAVRLARALGATLHVVHAALLSDPLLDAYAGMGYLTPEAVGAYQASAAAALREQVAALAGPGERPLCRVLAGPAALVLTDEAARLDADLVVVGATRRGPVARAILGTTAQQVLRGAPAPVLLLRTPLDGSVRRVLLATDLSPLSGAVHDRAVQVVAALAGAHPPELRSLLVVGSVRTPATTEGEPLQAVARVELRRFLEARPPALVPVEGRVRDGDPAREILAEAADWPADLVVLGTHGRSRTMRFLLGSVAEATLRGATGNVLVIPASVVEAEDRPQAGPEYAAAPAG